MIYISRKSLVQWAGPWIFQEGKSLFKAGHVLNVQDDNQHIQGQLSYGNRTMTSQFEVFKDGTVENRCPCKDSRERGIICSHVIALALAYIEQHSDPQQERTLRIEARKARRMSLREEKTYIRRLPENSPGSIPTQIELYLPEHWQSICHTSDLPISCFFVFENESHPAASVPTHLPLSFTPKHELLLYTLEDICEGPLQNTISVSLSDLTDILNLLSPTPLYLNHEKTPLRMSEDMLTAQISIEMQPTGELLLSHCVKECSMSSDTLKYIYSPHNAWVFANNCFHPLNHVLPSSLHSVYQAPQRISRNDVPTFIKHILPKIQSLLSEDTPSNEFGIQCEKGIPTFRLVLNGTPDCLNGKLYADYLNTHGPIAGKPDTHTLFAVPDPCDVSRYCLRNMELETDGLHYLTASGMEGQKGDTLTPIEGSCDVMHFLVEKIALLKRKGWSIEFEGRLQDMVEAAEWLQPVIAINASDQDGWFIVNIDFYAQDGECIPTEDVENVLLEGDSFIEHNNRIVLIDTNLIDAIKEVFDDCSGSRECDYGQFLVGDIHAGFVMASLKSIQGIKLEAAPEWLECARLQNQESRLKPVKFDKRLNRILRPYQKEGVSWLHFLERGGFCGILADEMGLGKTIQALAWINLKRCSAATEGRPSLIVCPTSLVENWAEETIRFTPDLSVHIVAGPRRFKTWDKIGDADVVITSYALLRRDIERYGQFRFSIAVLDEAQHIKNHSTLNAKAAKRIRADHRLVLTGTPIENSVADLWSIMDFLMPRYLGTHRQFKYSFEVPISNRGIEAEHAYERLRRKLRPFMMRRLKQEVAKELPPKIEKIAACSMSPDQKIIYNQLLDQYRSQIFGMVAEQGFDRSRFEIFKTLLRLRQVCCHLDLLQIPEANYDKPSAKMDLFLELLDEAMDGGHRVLVFSQFVSMLKILRKELDKRSIPYCYLDGSTRDRLKIVNEFNSNDSIPAFLISLKAGGSGLNLTGADMVIHFDPWWNPAVEDQATDRAHRIGQSKTVYSIKLITKDSVEEKVLSMQQRKKSIIDATISTEEQVVEKLSWDDVRELLTI